jgi:cysteinyl-tRNA synthetase
MEDAKKARGKIVEWMNEMSGERRKERGECECDENAHKEFADLYAGFRDAMHSDLNTPAALGAMFDLMAWTRKQKNFCGDVACDLKIAMTLMRHTFGCFEREDVDVIPGDALALAEERDAARAKKDFEESDRLRDALTKRGFEVRDTAEGTKLKRL